MSWQISQIFFILYNSSCVTVLRFKHLSHSHCPWVFCWRTGSKDVTQLPKLAFHNLHLQKNILWKGFGRWYGKNDKILCQCPRLNDICKLNYLESQVSVYYYQVFVRFMLWFGWWFITRFWSTLSTCLKIFYTFSLVSMVHFLKRPAPRPIWFDRVYI